MGIIRGVQKNDGVYVKALPSGEPYPLNSGLAVKFQEANITTLPEAVKYATDIFQSEPCMATRQLLERKKEDVKGKIFEKQRLGDYTWRTFLDVQNTIDAVGWGIRSIGVELHDRIGIFAETRAEWFIGAIGCLQHRITICTLYTTLNNPGLIHAINETEVKTLFTSYELLPRLLCILNQCPLVNQLVVMEDQLDGVGNNDIPKNVKIIPFRDLLGLGKELSESQKRPCPAANDTAIIMYTSGSTGTPKGVELTHTNILTSVIAYSVQMNVGPGDRFLAFLPLAHIMELVTEIAILSLGATLLYSNPNTLTSAGTKIMKGTDGDAKIAKPTVMNCVPLVLDRIIKGVTKQVERAGWIKSTIFSYAVRFKFWLEYIPLTSTILDYVVFRRAQEELGGCLKRLVVGGAPLSPQTHDTIRAIFGVSIQVGYGATETASCVTGMNEDDITTGNTGGPNLGILVRLRDWDEGGYRISDEPYSRGEIIVGGPGVAKGYFKLETESKKAFFEENGSRWFCTGDIGEVNECGSFRIIDRMKDLVKLKHGEYVSLGNAESKLKTLPIVDNICIFADSLQDKVVAVIVPISDNLLREADLLNIREENNLCFEALCKEDKINSVVLSQIQEHGRKCGLNRFEIPAAVYLSPEPWTPETGMVTAALKLRRKQLKERFLIEIEDMYLKLE